MGTTFKNHISICLFLHLLLLHIFPSFSQPGSSDRIIQGQSLVDGQLIISAGENFAVGFFSSGNSTNRYLGIWYNKIPVQTVIWIANRDKPISGTTGVLRIGDDGNLMVFDGNTSIWSSNTSSATANSTAVLTDSGNLILLRNENVGDQSKALWESFRYPTDTYLPDMRVYTNVITGRGTGFTSWKSNDDPTSGNYSISLDPRASPQLVVWNGPKRHWRSGHWNGLIFTGLPRMTALILYGFKLTNEGNGNIYFTYTMVNSSIITRFKLRWDGTIDQFVWDEGLRQWNVLLSEPSNDSEIYNNCGMFGVSNAMGSPICSCLEGFKPKYASQWEKGKYSDGCIRSTPLQCNINSTNDVFREVRGLKWPDFADTAAVANINKCRDLCVKNCTCNAYTFASGIGCMIWSGDLVDLEHFDEGGNSLYVRLAKSELGSRKKISYVLWIVIAAAITVVVGIIILILWRFNRKLPGITEGDRTNGKVIHDMSSTARGFSAVFSEADDIGIDGKSGSVPQLPLYSFNDIEIATKDFANQNKLGEGGFGSVYKGTLPGGVEVAVKRLSKWSGQGLGEFKTELTLIAKLQHRNLVRLLGCCIEGEEKLLIYEFMPNKSLDSFLFDSFKKSLLDWKTRFAIIGGIARGLLYLHRDSRLRIIHRDLKASNILLDEEMNPKISDFGMARIFGGNQNEASTVRVVGTYGYMSPEYAMEGLFSVKSDVYSFGVLLLELVSGLRNSSFHSPECSNLIRHAWSLWKDNKAAELIDPSIAGSCSEDEALRCINVAILCVQSSAADRPTMSSVVTMLESVNTKISMPGQVDICLTSSKSLDFIMECHENSSSVEVPITEVTGSPTNSTSRRYVGIWYNKISVQTVVWVANRDDPITTTSGVLSLDNTGNLVLFDSQKPDVVVWSTNVSSSSSIVTSSYTAELLDSGNFVVHENDRINGFVWQSFDFPTDTQLPEMIIGVNRRSGFNRLLTSWKSPDNPGTGSYSLMIDVNGSRPQLFLYRDGIPFWRAGHWNGVRYSGIPEMNTSNSIFKVKYIDNPEEVSLWFSLRNTSVFSRLVLTESPRTVERQTWQEDVHKWGVFYSAPKDECDYFSHCGAFGNCNSFSAGDYECKCLPGFEPKSPRDWNLRDGSQGCVPKQKGQMCRDGEGFVKLAEVKLPETTKTKLEMNLDDKACADLCLKNCSCTGYASANASGGSFSGCITWYNELVDLREYPSGGQDFYLRVDAVELENWKIGASAPKDSNKSNRFHGYIKVLVIVPLSVAFFVLLSVTYYWLIMKKKTAQRKQENISLINSNINNHGISVDGSPTGEEGNDIETSTSDVKIYSLSTIVAATENFSLAHKVGEGGFGSVYKGKLHNGQDIAVKRLSNTSGQGMKEFRNEVTLIAKLQHRNLVRLFGYCTQNEEKMLIYEYLPNKGLDCFLFDKENNGMLDWEKRFSIILGIARGMVYLHHDSRLRIIHRDLKASNILLDALLNPKISDFGMARISGSDQIEEQTKRVVGTYGYMSPEYAMQGHFSIKSDVFSFGVLLLEIITGRKSSSYYTEDSVNLIGHVWDLWRESNVLEVVDQSLGESRHHDPRILRCIHIGLLCVQESATARPSMSEVVFMLCNETSLPPPGQVAFIFRTSDRGPTSTSSTSVGANASNELTVSTIQGR